MEARPRLLSHFERKRNRSGLLGFNGNLVFVTFPRGLGLAVCLFAAVWACLLPFECSGGSLFDGHEFERQTWRSENGLPQNTVHAILQSRAGYIWVGTEGGLARFDGVRFAVFNTQNTPELQSNNIRQLVEARDGALWMATADGVTRLQDGRFRTFDTRGGLPSANVLGLREDGSGGLWAVTAAGTARFRRERFRAERRPVTPLPVSYRAADGTLWVGTEQGLTRIVDGRAAPLNSDNSFHGEAVLAITGDREGNIWVGTESGGLSILRVQKFRTLTARDGLPENLIRCVFADREGTVWVGTDGQGLARYRNGGFTTLTTRDGLTSDVILALGESSDGSLLVGTPDGLDRIENGRISAITSADGLPDDLVRSIATGSDGSLWIGTRRGLAHLRNGQFTIYTEVNGLGSDVIGAMQPDGENGLWIATLHGLTRLKGGRLKNYTTADGLASNVITALDRDRENNLWIGTAGGGLNVFEAGRFVHFPARLELPTLIYGIAADGDGHLWISSNSGLFCASRAELLRFARGEARDAAVISYGTSDGLLLSEASGGGHPSIAEAKDGTMWFATLKGVAIKRGGREEMNRVPPPVVIESVSVDDRVMNPRQLHSIAPGHSRVSFEYAGLSFVAPRKVRFRYKLDGLDRDWVDAGTRRVAYYTNLPPGKYMFRVAARNNDGLWNESGAGLAFGVEPHFYETVWFRSLLLVAAGVLAWWIYGWRVRQVEAQFGAVLQERNRIAREIHDTLAQGFAGVSVQLELVSRLLASSAEAAREHLDQARVLVRNSLAEARRSIWDLRSQSAYNQDFAARLSHMASQVAGAGPAKVTLQVRGAYRPLEERTEGELLKIAQEAVTNAVRHAEAAHIDIELAFDARKLRMTIADDGRGFEEPFSTSGPDGHFGLQGMRERADAIAAALKVQSAAGRGTKILVETSVD